MRCTNCGATVPRDSGTCPECGVFARVVSPKSENSRLWILALLLVAAGVGAFTYFATIRETHLLSRTPVRVVHDRPGGARRGSGAAISEPEAILRLQRSFGLAPDSVAIMSKGYSDGVYVLDAINRCDGTRLGRWRVDGKTGNLSKGHG